MAAAGATASAPADAPSAPVGWAALNRQARAQAKAGDHAGLHDTLAALQPLMPGNPRIVYNLAATAARTGRVDEALAQLTRLADAGLLYELDGDEDFIALAARDDFHALRDRLRGNGRTIGTPHRLAALVAADSILESLAWDAATRRLFLASVRHCEIRVMGDPRRRGARDRPFVRLPASVFALAVDAARHRLWATVAVVAQGDGCGAAPKDIGRTALLALDLRTGRVLQRVEAGLPGVLGDMLLAADGTVFVSESLHGAVLRLRPGAAAFERLDPPGEFVSPQTPALSADGRTLLVPDYVRGLAAIDLDAPQAAPRWLDGGPGVFSAGIDGLVRDGDELIAVQNGSAPPRVLRLAADLSRQQVLESGTPGLGEPTHGIVVGRSFWFVSDVGWDRLGDDGRPRPGAAPARPQLRAIALGAGAP
jgi:hypothetical protein